MNEPGRYVVSDEERVEQWESRRLRDETVDPEEDLTQCPQCLGLGWTEEHLLNWAERNGQRAHSCIVCPVQMICDTCAGTGVKPAIVDDLDEAF